jgi:hypothetical protein
MMKRILALLTSLIFGSGGRGTASSGDPAQVPPVAPRLQRGGVYATKNQNGQYSISKVLEVDEFAVHLRFYNEKFSSVPTDIDTSTLTYLIGHVPLAVEGFLIEERILITVEDVKEDELEGYKLYLEAMRHE